VLGFTLTLGQSGVAIIFMVISYNQNLHFRIHCKKPLEIKLKFISSYFDNNKNSNNNINIKIIAKVCFFLIIEN
jgi:hypothetical protein